MTSSEAETVTATAERTLGPFGQLAASSLLGQPGPIAEALGGKTSMAEGITKFMQSLGRLMPQNYPVLGMVSTDGQFLGENVFLGGRRFNEAAAGLQAQYAQESPGELLAGAAFQWFWPTRSVTQRRALGAPADVSMAMLSELYGPSFNPLTPDGKAKLQARRLVNRQLFEMIGDLYSQHMDEFGKPETAEITLDERVAGTLTELFEHTRSEGDGPLAGWFVEPGYTPKGALLRMIATRPPDEQSAMIDYARRWTSQPRFQEDGLNAVFEAGRRLEMGKDLFTAALRNAMDDPGGAGLVGWWWSQIKGGDRATMEALGGLLWDVRTPAEGSAAWHDWVSVLSAYASHGVVLPPILGESTQRAVDARLRQVPAQMMLQGGQALSTELSRRPLLDVLNPK